MKKIISLLLVVVLVVALAACGTAADVEGSAKVEEPTKTNEPGSEGKRVEETREVRIAWINPLIGNPVYKIQDEGSMIAAEDYGVTVDILGATTIAPELYVEQIEIAVAEKYDGIILCPYNPGAMEPAIQAAIDAGIPVVNTIMDTLGKPELRMSLLGLDLNEFGALQADSIADKKGGTGKLVYAQTSFENPTQNAIRDGFEAQLATYPNMELLITEALTPDVMTATEKIQNIFTAYPELDSVVVNDATGATVAARVAKEMNREVDILTIDDVPETLDMIKKGEIWGTIAQNMIGVGYESVRIILDKINGEEVPDFVKVPMTLVTEDNVDTYLDELLDMTHKKGIPW